MLQEIILTPAQEQQIIDLWNKNPDNPPSIKDLTIALFGEGFDGRSHEAKAIKKFLATRNLRARTAADNINLTDEIELTQPHQEYIINNIRTMSALEIGRVIFSNPNLTALAAEIRAIAKFCKTLNPMVVHAKDEDIPDGEYTPPKNLDQVVARVNKYLNYLPVRDKMTPTQKKQMETLIGFMHTHRFVAQMDNYDSVKDRRLAEDAFIRSTYDKPDLAQEEIDQYIEYSNQVVEGFKIQKRKEILQRQQEEMADASDSDSRKYSMGLVEAIGKASTEYNLCKKREQDLLDSLKVTRSERISQQVSSNASIINLVQTWKDEEGRAELLRHADKEQEAMKNEVARLSSLPELKARILGLSKDAILNG